MKFGKGREIGWGILLLAGAALLILSQVGFELTLGQFSWFQIVILIGCAWLAITGLFELQFFNLTFAVALGYVIADKPMGWPEIDAWIVFLAALFAAIGLHKIFRRKFRKGMSVHIGEDGHYIHFDSDDEDTEDVEYREVVDEDCPGSDKDGKRSYYGKEVVFANKTIYTGEAEQINGEYVFSGVNAYVEGQRVRAMNLDVVFSNARIYFDKAKLQNNYAEINADVVFARMHVYVPKGWNVVEQTGKVIGRSSTFTGPYNEGAPTLCIKGDCVCGGIHVKRI